MTWTYDEDDSQSFTRNLRLIDLLLFSAMYFVHHCDDGGPWNKLTIPEVSWQHHRSFIPICAWTASMYHTHTRRERWASYAESLLLLLLLSFRGIHVYYLLLCETLPLPPLSSLNNKMESTRNGVMDSRRRRLMPKKNAYRRFCSQQTDAAAADAATVCATNTTVFVCAMPEKWQKFDFRLDKWYQNGSLSRISSHGFHCCQQRMVSDGGGVQLENATYTYIIHFARTHGGPLVRSLIQLQCAHLLIYTHCYSKMNEC